MIWFMQISSEIVLQYHEFQSIWRNSALSVEKFRQIDEKSPAILLLPRGCKTFAAPRECKSFALPLRNQFEEKICFAIEISSQFLI